VRTPLARALSKLGLASRSEARRLIRTGRVSVDGRVVRDPLAAVNLEQARIAVDGTIGALASRVVVALHKPRGVVTTRRDPQGRPTVYGLVEGAPGRLFPVGRLDLATAGLLLFTNDTRFGDWLADPRSGVTKVYLVTVRGRVSEPEFEQLRAGIEVRDARLTPHAVVLRKTSARESHLVITLTEGQNREVRRLCEAIGHAVTRLRRVQIGELELGTLKPGAWRLVDDSELARAFPAYFSSSFAPSPR
jgi:23S rRNA pseudouridine2605 synthase